MSILVQLSEHVREQRIVHVVPPFGPQVRDVYATRAVFEQLDPDTADARFDGSAGALRGWLDNFSRGRRIVVGNRKSKKADMKILERSGGVWEIRKRASPSTRIFGHFIEPNCFLAVDVHLVSDLFDEVWEIKNWLNEKIGEVFPNWASEIRNCKSEWRKLFPTYDSFIAETISGYLSYATHEGDL
jgi:hypothetical protein